MREKREREREREREKDRGKETRRKKRSGNGVRSVEYKGRLHLLYFWRNITQQPGDGDDGGGDPLVLHSVRFSVSPPHMQITVTPHSSRLPSQKTPSPGRQTDRQTAPRPSHTPFLLPIHDHIFLLCTLLPFLHSCVPLSLPSSFISCSALVYFLDFVILLCSNAWLPSLLLVNMTSNIKIGPYMLLETLGVGSFGKVKRTSASSSSPYSCCRWTLGLPTFLLHSVAFNMDQTRGNTTLRFRTSSSPC